MRYKLAIFDFDGTLADSFPFFLQVFNQLAERHGFKQMDPASAHSYRGHSPRQMMSHVGMPAWKLPVVAKDFIALMRDNVSSIKPFEGIDDVLSHLAGRGVTLAIVSSNSHDNVSAVLGPDSTRLISHFECGMSIFGKSKRILKALRDAATGSHEAIYIGDQITDLEASRQVGVAFGAVTWGYGTIESLRTQSPEEEFERVADLKRIAQPSAT
jgi:phosphoglycolate phosphatase